MTDQQMFVLPLFVLVHREDPLLRRLASALLVLLALYPASWELLLSGTLTLRLLIFLFSFPLVELLSTHVMFLTGERTIGISFLSAS